MVYQQPAVLSVLCVLSVVGAAGRRVGASHECPNTADTSEAWFETILAGTVTIDSFFQDIWGKRPLVLAGDKRRHSYHDLVPVTLLDQIVDSRSTHPGRMRKGCVASTHDQIHFYSANTRAPSPAI
jgi:hypothetical protein